MLIKNRVSKSWSSNLSPFSSKTKKIVYGNRRQKIEKRKKVTALSELFRDYKLNFKQAQEYNLIIHRFQSSNIQRNYSCEKSKKQLVS